MIEAAATPLLIWGAGAIGGTVGAYLARAGVEVLFVDAVREHVAEINAHGIAIEGPIDTFATPARALTPDQVTGTFGRILLCVKSHHTAAATKQLAPHLAEDGYVASFQNGLNEYVIAETVGMARVIGAFVNFGADYLSPGRILFGGRGAVVLGEMDGTLSPRLDALHRVITGFEPNAIVTNNIVGYLWGKLGYGALLFATALTDDPIADVLGDATHRSVLSDLACEVMQVAAARRVHPLGFNGFDPTAFRPGSDASASFAAMAAHNRTSAKTHSGIWRDLAVHGRATEVDAQLGPIAEAGRAAGVPTPLVRRLTYMIHEIELGQRPMTRANLDELAA
jgi:2-dehydropantoate 2-reductase